MKQIVFFFWLISLTFPVSGKLKSTILPGAYQTQFYFPLLKDKSLGVVANQTSLIGRIHLVDTLLSAGFKIQKVFAPEHGFRGNVGAGEEIKNSVDNKTGISIVSLYGKHLKPDSVDMNGINLMIFDIQDVGVRFYTYISTLQYVMETCAEHKIPLIVLDRPNPHGSYIDGPVLEPGFTSFVGMQPVPVVYGMTIGEYAKMLNGEHWLKRKLKCDLTVIPVLNYFHSLSYRLPVPPSPNLPNQDAINLYPSLCFFEGTSVSIGRGTTKPFGLIGYPGNPSGDITFKPEAIQHAAPHPLYQDTLCTGFDLTGEGATIIKERKIQLKWLIDLYSSYANKKQFFNPFFDKLAGTSSLREKIIANKTEDEIRKSWAKGIKKFKLIRKKYLLYSDFE